MSSDSSIGQAKIFQSLAPASACVVCPPSDCPVYANFEYRHLTVGAGVAIFHLASARVVVCYHSRDKYWFLPKGRRDANEETGPGAEREGFEESGYRNRLLPISLSHRQPKPHNPAGKSMTPFVTEPIWTQLVPQSPRSQYLLFWYIAETLPPDIEQSLNAQTKEQASSSSENPYQYPPRYPDDLTLAARLKLEPQEYEPLHHPNTGVDDEEAQYVSHLLPINEALQKLKGSLQQTVVNQGWEGICLRHTMENLT
ncbi:MAG: hypothetical protein M1834_000992 [Cirrosporium novae-zelandiae]|nr:MAG: hypothetical protein M1834_000992 [Cirrosporium novae-zelandiae]